MKSHLFAVAAALTLSLQASAATPPSPEGHYTRTIYLIRHGSYDRVENVDDNVFNGLSPLGVAQAKLMAARLRGIPVAFTSLVSSTATRARQTALVIHEMFPQLPLQTTPLLCEGTPWTSNDVFNQKHPTAEMNAAVARMDQAFATYFVPATEADQHDILVCHGNIISYFLIKALGVNPKAWPGFTIENASLTVIRVDPKGKFHVLAVSDIGHIPPNLQSAFTQKIPQLVSPER